MIKSEYGGGDIPDIFANIAKVVSIQSEEIDPITGGNIETYTLENTQTKERFGGIVISLFTVSVQWVDELTQCTFYDKKLTGHLCDVINQIHLMGTVEGGMM